MALKQIWALIIDCLRDALHRKIFWVMALISLFLAATLACISFDGRGVVLLFGTWHIEAESLALGNPERLSLIGYVLTYGIANMYIGWIGIIIALIGTAGIFPALMERGAIDVVLAKPISRPMVFLGKYLGGMVFVGLQAVIFVVPILFVAGLRWDYWIWPFLWCIPLIVLLFSYVYAFSALFGVITRSAMASLLLSLLAWIAIFVPQVLHESLLQAPAFGFELPAGWARAVSVAKTIVPNTREITYIAGNLLEADPATEVGMQPQAPPGEPVSLYNPDQTKLVEASEEIMVVDTLASIGSSLLFEAVVVLLAMWKFCRRDF